MSKSATLTDSKSSGSATFRLPISTALNDDPKKAPVRTPLFVSVWRWHFYAGLIVFPIVVFLSITGSIYLFNDEIEERLNPTYFNVPVTSVSVPSAQLVTTALRAFPGSRPVLFAPPIGPGRSAEVQVKVPDGRVFMVFMNPYSGVVLGSVNAAHRFTQVIRDIHGKLFLGKFGQLFVETMACWVFVLMVTGVYLWWPRPSFAVLGTLIPRWRKGGRISLRDFHAIPQIYLSFFVLFLIVSGLPWAVIGGMQVKWLQALTHETNPPDLRFSQPEPGHDHGDGKSKTPATHQPGSGKSAMAGMAGMPQDPEPKDWLEKQPMLTKADIHSEPHDGVPPLTVDQIISKAQGLSLPTYEIRFPQTPQGVFMITGRSDEPKDKRFVYFEQYTGSLMGDYQWKDFGIVARSVSTGISLHQGRFFGLPNQLLGLFTCMGLIAATSFGVAMWWKRKPKGKIGVPRTPQKASLGILTVLIVICSIALPLVGASLIIVAILDGWMIPRFPRLQTFLS